MWLYAFEYRHGKQFRVVNVLRWICSPRFLGLHLKMISGQVTQWASTASSKRVITLQSSPAQVK